MSFDELGLSPHLLKAVGDTGYTTPTAIQQKAIPYVLMGRDILGLAQTGTGKTASFTLPMIDILSEGRARARIPRSLILEPTRELATQVADSFNRYSRHSSLSMALVIGGESMKDQIALIEKGVDVLIATPGRLLDLFERGQVMMMDTRMIVIDEADRMLDMGFMPDIEKIISLLPAQKQTLLFSATMPKEIEKLANRFLKDPKRIEVSRPSSTSEKIVQNFIAAPSVGKEKRATLRNLIAQEDVKAALVFCNRKRDVDILQKSFSRHALPSVALHGDMTQSLRGEALEAFKNGDVRFLICSDVAARGLDIPAVSHVFNFDVPNYAEDYVHRIGRTGRAGRTGVAITLVTKADAKALKEIEKITGKPIAINSPAVEMPEEKPKNARASKRKASDTKSPQTQSSEQAPVNKKTSSSSGPPSISSPGEEDRKTSKGNVSDRKSGQERYKAQSDSLLATDQEDSHQTSTPSPFGDHTPAFFTRDWNFSSHKSSDKPYL